MPSALEQLKATGTVSYQLKTRRPYHILCGNQRKHPNYVMVANTSAFEQIDSCL